jgi:hypothetical protein
MNSNSEGTFSMPSSHTPDALVVAFDDDHAVANAGLALTATLAERLGVETVVDELVDLGDRPGHHRPGRKVLTLLHAMVAGGDAIDDADVLRTGRTQEVLGHRVMAPSTLGTFLRSFSFGHIRQLDRVAETLLARAWAAGAGPGTQELTMDLDSTVCQVHGHAKGGAAYGYTHRLGDHPLLASRADTGELLHLRMRTGSANTGRGAERFVNELAGRVRRAGATGPLTLRGDSGFWSGKVIGACRRHGIGFSITVRQTKPVTAAIAAIGEDAWTDIDYPDGGAAQVAETTLAGKAGGRLIVRRTRLVGAQATLWPDWRHHAFITDRAGTGCLAGRRPPPPRRGRARHPRPQAGHRAVPLPSGVFGANAAWALVATLAHNLLRWVAALGLGTHGLVVAKTIRRRFITLPGRLTHAARRRSLHLPSGWPWAEGFLDALARLRALPLRT